jgi:hypothetical protein
MKTNLSLINTTGFKVILLYLVITYIPSFIFSIIFLDDFRENFNGFEGNLFGLPMLLICPILGLVLLLDKFIPKSTGKIIFGKLCPYRYKLINYILIFVFLYFSFRFYTEYGLQFVHTGDSLADSAGFVKYFYALKVYFNLFLFYELINLLILKERFNSQLLLYLLLVLCSLLGLSGSMDIVYLFFTIVLIVLPNNKIVIALSTHLKKRGRLLKNVIVLICCFLVGVIVVFVGYANKFGSKDAFNLFIDKDFFYILIIPTLIRFANSYSSFICIANEYLWDLSMEIDAISIPFEVLKYRFSVIVGLTGNKPEIFNVSRLNYINTYKYFHVKAGASPGLLGSALYIPFFPLNLLFLSFYLLYIVRIINKVFDRKMSLIGILIVFIFTIPLFESPIDYLIFIDPSVISLVLFMLIMHSFIDRKIIDL